MLSQLPVLVVVTFILNENKKRAQPCCATLNTSMGNWLAGSADPPVQAQVAHSKSQLKHCPGCGYDVPTTHFRRLNGQATTTRCIGCNKPQLRSAYTKRKLLNLLPKIKQKLLTPDQILTRFRRLQRYSYEANSLIQYSLNKLEKGPLTHRALYKWVLYITPEFKYIGLDDPEYRNLLLFQNIVEQNN